MDVQADKGLSRSLVRKYFFRHERILAHIRIVNLNTIANNNAS